MFLETELEITVQYNIQKSQMKIKEFTLSQQYIISWNGSENKLTWPKICDLWQKPTLIFILSGEFVTERLSSVFSDTQNIGGYKFKCDRDMKKKMWHTDWWHTP